MTSRMTEEAARSAQAAVAQEFSQLYNVMTANGWQAPKNGESISAAEFGKLDKLATAWAAEIFISNTTFLERVMDEWQDLMASVMKKESGGQSVGPLVSMLTSLATRSPINFAIALLAITAGVVHTRSNKSSIRILTEYGLTTADPYLHIAAYTMRKLQECGEGTAAYALLPSDVEKKDETTGENLTPNALFEPLQSLVPAQFNGMNFSINGRLFFILMNREGGCKEVFNKMREYLVYQSTAYGICKAADSGFTVGPETYMIDYSTHMSLFPRSDKSASRMYAFVQDFVRSMQAFRNSVNGGSRLSFGVMRTFLQRFIKAMREDPKCRQAIKDMSAKDLDIALGFADSEGHAFYNNIPGQLIPGSSPAEFQWVGLPLSLPPKDQERFTFVNQDTPRTEGYDTREERTGQADYKPREIVRSATGTDEGLRDVTSASAKAVADEIRRISIMNAIGISESAAPEIRNAAVAAYAQALREKKTPAEAVTLARATLAGTPPAPAAAGGASTVSVESTV